MTGQQNKTSSNFRFALTDVHVATTDERRPADSQRIPPKRRALAIALVLLLNLIFSIGFRCAAQSPPPTEYQIKAAFIFNFVKFVAWPSQTFATEDSPIVVGVMGSNVFGDNLEHALHNKRINNRPLQYEVFNSIAEMTNCQVLFISASEEKRFPEILGALHSKSVLTVSESDRFIDAGGVINFVIQQNRIHFQVNNAAAKSAGLKISSKLLDLAVPNH